MIAGTEGDGKTSAMIALAAAVTTGGKLPDGKQAPIGDVIMWTGEDDDDDTIVPRLMACGGDRERFFLVHGARNADGSIREFDAARDLPALGHAARRLTNLALIIIDPISVVVTGNENENSSVRRSLAPALAIARGHDVALVGVTHFRKNKSEGVILDWILGSKGWTAAARLVLVTIVDPKTGERIMIRVKSNIGPTGTGFVYRVEQAAVPGFGFAAQAVRWIRMEHGDAKALFARYASDGLGATRPAACSC